MKLAMSLDGRTAMYNGNSKWITSKASRKDVHKFRAKSSAILSGSNTIITDNPFLTVRYNNITRSNLYKKNIKHPIKIILDSKNRMRPSFNIFADHHPVWLIKTKKDKQFWPKNVKQIIMQKKDNKIDLLQLFYFLGKKELNYIWVEAGSTLFHELIKINIIDELILYIAPKILGDTAKPLCNIKSQLKFLNMKIFSFDNTKKIGTDLRVILKPKTNSKILF